MPKFSQVFLADNKICSRIVHALDDEDFDFLTEIGPGGGALTALLFPKYSNRMQAVEIDRDLVPKLSKTYNGLKTINKDFMRVDINELCDEKIKKMAFIGNLPYDCSTAILEKVITMDKFSCAVFMFQKEVADRILAKVGEKEYGVLSLTVQLYASGEKVCDVKAGSFRPVPAVDSAVLKFNPVKNVCDNPDKVRNIINKSFMHRRKKLINSLVLCGIDKQKAENSVKEIGLTPNARAQELNLEQYIKLTESMLR